MFSCPHSTKDFKPLVTLQIRTTFTRIGLSFFSIIVRSKQQLCGILVLRKDCINSRSFLGRGKRERGQPRRAKGRPRMPPQQLEGQDVPVERRCAVVRTDRRGGEREHGSNQSLGLHSSFYSGNVDTGSDMKFQWSEKQTLSTGQETGGRSPGNGRARAPARIGRRPCSSMQSRCSVFA